MAHPKTVTWLIATIAICCLCQDVFALSRRLQSQTGPKAGGRKQQGKAPAKPLASTQERRLMSTSNETYVAVCEFDEGRQSAFGGHCFVNDTWRQERTAESPISLARIQFAARQSACRKHMPLSSMEDPTQAQIDACIADTANMCFMDVGIEVYGVLVDNVRPFCNTAPDWVEAKDMYCEGSPDHTVASCMAMKESECKQSDECTSLMQSYIETLDPEALAAWGATEELMGAGWFNYNYCWPRLLTDTVDGDNGNLPFWETMEILFERFDAILDLEALPGNYTIEEWFGSCTYGTRKQAQWASKHLCESLNNGTWGLLQGPATPHTVTLPDGTQVVELAGLLDNEQVDACSSLKVDGVPICHVAHGRVFSKEGDETLVAHAMCRNTPWLANIHWYGDFEEVMEAFSVCYESGSKFDGMACANTTIPVPSH